MDPRGLGAERLAEVPFSGIRKVFEAVRRLEAEGRRVVHWQIGRPDFDTPAHIKAAAVAALERGEVHYAPNAGIPLLREAIARRHGLDTGRAADPATQVIVMAGANEGVMVSMLALVNPGDEVLVPTPNWHHYRACVHLAGGVPVEVPLREEDGFELKAAEVGARLGPRTRMLVLASPHNPTGAVVGEGDLAAIAELARRGDFLVLSDEIYTRITYEGVRARSIASFPGMEERTIVVNGFSKAYSMDGWRLGWTVASPAITSHLLKVRQYTTVCVNTFIQHGAAAGLAGDQACVEEMVAAFAARRRVILDGLRSIPGVSAAEPGGAFYVFPNVASFGRSSQEMADYLLNKHGVATVAGSAFGSGGEGYLRIAYSCSLEECREGVGRLRGALGASGGRR
ncbi:MAG: pyridoxal phosphate-dependent aminotransferase [Nitrospinota bacterium]